jgi:tetratricopeptide (TPR) repeat protein
MKKIVCLFIFLQVSSSLNACLNYYYSTDKEGHLHVVTDELRKKFNINFNKELNVTRLLKLEAKLKKEHSYMLLSDYALGLMKLGKTSEALQLLAEISKHYPNDFRIASNLGTAYELNGQNDSALKYIKHGLKLNPNDHEGSEWVHVKVLETKLRLSKDPQFLKNTSVLNLSETQEKDTNVCRHILIQVHERFPFTPAPDPIMASLMTDLGDCLATTIALEYALSSYQIAREYFGDKSTELAAKIAATKELIKQHVNIQPDKSREKMDHAMHSKMRPFAYKIMLENNDLSHYEVNWSALNTNVKILLGFANLTLDERTVKDSAIAHQDQDMRLTDPHQVTASTQPSVSTPSAELTASTKTEEPRSVNVPMTLGFFAIAIILTAVAIRKRKK